MTTDEATSLSQQAHIQQVLRHVSSGGHWAFAFNEKEKLMFCWIEKVGCSRFKSLIMNLHSKMGTTFRLKEITDRKRGESYKMLLQDPTVHKAVFYREPMERFLSGYLNKCIGESTRHYCLMVFGDKNASFEDAVTQMPLKDPAKLDYHFMPQYRHCGGLTREILDTVYTTVEPLLDLETTDVSVRKMLAKFELSTDEFSQVYASSRSGHATDSSTKVEEYYSKDPKLVATIVKYFLQDYLTFNMPVPLFAQKVLRELHNSNNTHALSKEDMDILGIPMEPPTHVVIDTILKSATSLVLPPIVEIETVTVTVSITGVGGIMIVQKVSVACAGIFLLGGLLCLYFHRARQQIAARQNNRIAEGIRRRRRRGNQYIFPNK
eukprot:scaffold421390_cov62-Attheya_sp.AAC.1